MTGLPPRSPAADRLGLLSRANPLTRLIAGALATLPLIVMLEPVSGLVVWLAATVGFRLAGMTLREQLRRTVVVLVLAPLTAVSMVLYGQAGGRRWWEWGPVVISDASLWQGLAVVTRVLGLGVPVVLLLADVDPTDLADACIQVLHLPERFVLGTLAGLRTMHLLSSDQRSLRLARRARGVGDGWALRRAASTVFAMLVLALRRAGDLATAMEARGFGAGRRTHARQSRLTWRDPVLVALGVLCGALALLVPLAAGTFTTVWSRR